MDKLDLKPKKKVKRKLEKYNCKAFIFSILLLSFLFSMNFISAAYLQSSQVDLKIPTNQTGCVLTLAYPNSSNIFSNQFMTDNIGYSNYTFIPTALGEYKGYSNCSLNEIIIEVNPTGTVSTISQSIGSLGFLFLMLVLMFVFGIVGFTLFKNEYLWVVGVFFVFLASLLLIYNTWLGYEYHKYISGLPISGIPETIFYVLLLIIVLGILVSLALLFTYWKEIFKYVKSEIKKKDESQDTEDWDFDEWENRLNR